MAKIKEDSFSDMIIKKIDLQVEEEWKKDIFKKEFRAKIEEVIKEWMK